MCFFVFVLVWYTKSLGIHVNYSSYRYVYFHLGLIYEVLRNSGKLFLIAICLGLIYQVLRNSGITILKPFYKSNQILNFNIFLCFHLDLIYQGLKNSGKLF